MEQQKGTAKSDNKSYFEQIAKKLEAIGILSPVELLLRPPAKYKDYRFPERGINSCTDPNKKYLLKLKLTRSPGIKKTSNKRDMAVLSVSDGVNNASCLTFDGVWALKSKKEGAIIHVVAKVGKGVRGIELQEVEMVNDSDAGKIVAQYKGKEKVVNGNQIKRAVTEAIFDKMEETCAEILSKTLSSESELMQISGNRFNKLSDLIMAIHYPKSSDDISKASESVRLIVSYQALKQSQATTIKTTSTKSIIKYDVDTIKSVLQHLSFTLTNDQKRCIWEISKDLESPFPMDRLISGDVGCGKTMAYAIPAICAFLSGAKVCILSPNGILAKQIYDEISAFPPAKTQLIVQGYAKNEDNDNYTGEIIIGTTAILTWMKRQSSDFSFDLVIIDEQQKLGVKQKQKLTQNQCNLIEATATAIPRTAASVVYGNKKVSFIEECPYKKDISSKIFGTEQKREAYNELVKVIDSGASIAALYPVRKKDYSLYQIKSNEIGDCVEILIATIDEHGGTIVSKDTQDGDEIYVFKIKNREIKKIQKAMAEKTNQLPLLLEIDDVEEIEKCRRSVEEACKYWEKLYPGYVGMIHGGLSEEEKAETISKAKAGLLKVIVTSTVVEIGLTIPGLRAVIVLEADRYGASTLHQIRGRVARNGGNGLFIMMASKATDQMSEKAIDRLNILVKHNKGSDISSEDMRQRGFGDLSMQTGKQSGYINGVFSGIKMTPQDLDNLLDNLRDE